MNNVPNLRFKEFSDEWQRKHLNEMVERITRKNKGLLSKLPLTISAQYGLVDQETFFNKTVASKNLEGYYLLKNGEFAYNKSYSNGYPWGAIKRLDKYECGVLSSLYICFKPYQGICSDFLTNYFETTKWHKEVSMIAVEGARNHGLLNIAVSDFFETLHYVPAIEEQEKIASFFSLIDKKIELQTEKVEELKNYKKGIMQKIFSQELRFKDEKGNKYPEWEERKLEDFIVEYKEKTTVDNQYPVLTSSRNGLMLQTDYFKDRQVTTEENIGYHIIPRGYITFRSRSDDTTFKFNQNNLIDKGIISYFYPVFYFNESLNDMYALYFMNNYLGCQIRREIVGTSQLVLSLNKLKQLKIPVPCIEEQNKIGKLVDNLENKILQEQNKLNYFTRYKKGLLQQMFI